MPDNVIEIRNLTRSFSKKTALAEVSLSVPRGIVFGLVGENGAGKTTLIKHLLGLLAAQDGTVTVFGRNPVDDPVGVLGRIGYLSEDRDLPDWMTVGELMRYTQAFFPNWDEAFAEELRRMFELDARQKIKALSRGQRARAGLLVALAHRPELLVLDEPSSGLDAVVRRDILTAIVRTVADEGRTVLFSSHLLDEVERVADLVAMLHGGQLVLTGPLDEIVGAHRRLTIRFSEPQVSTPVFPGAISCEGQGQEWNVLCDGEQERLRQSLAETGAEVVEESPASLEEIFVARVHARAATKMAN